MAAIYLRSFFQRDTLQCARESGFWKAGKQDHLEGASKAWTCIWIALLTSGVPTGYPDLYTFAGVAPISVAKALGI
jgi:hypothetical protein